MIEAAADWEPAFVEWLRPFLEALGHRVRQRWAPVYVRGLLGPGERKSVQPMAARIAPSDCDQLQFGDNSALERAIAVFRDALALTPRVERPEDWAMTQANLGNAFLRLGEREAGTA